MTGPDFTRRNEGCCLEAKPDAKGMWAIGWGHDIPPSPGLTCTQEQADYWFQSDYDTATQGAAFDYGLGWRQLDAVRQAALIDMAYEMGRSGLGEFAHLLNALQACDYSEAYTECLNSTYAEEVSNRAHTVALMLKTGEWPA